MVQFGRIDDYVDTFFTIGLENLNKFGGTTTVQVSNKLEMKTFTRPMDEYLEISRHVSPFKKFVLPSAGGEKNES